MCTIVALGRICGEQHSLDQYRVHVILSKHRISLDYFSVDGTWWEATRFTERGSEGDVGTNKDSPD